MSETLNEPVVHRMGTAVSPPAEAVFTGHLEGRVEALEGFPDDE
jgi:hypothetical protein